MGSDGAKFELSASTGPLLQVTEPDFEKASADANKDNVYEVTVRASDGTMYADRMVRVTVTATSNEAPDVIR